MYIEIYYWGPASDIKKLIQDTPKVFKAAPDSYVVVLKEYDWKTFLYEVATNPKRKTKFGADDLTEPKAVKADEEGKGLSPWVWVLGFRVGVIGLLAHCLSWPVKACAMLLDKWIKLAAPGEAVTRV